VLFVRVRKRVGMFARVSQLANMRVGMYVCMYACMHMHARTKEINMFMIKHAGRERES
jgi:hypothetical protein